MYTLIIRFDKHGDIFLTNIEDSLKNDLNIEKYNIDDSLSSVVSTIYSLRERIQRQIILEQKMPSKRIEEYVKEKDK